MHRQQRIHAAAPQLDLGSTGYQLGAEYAVAEVFEQQQPRVEIARDDPRRRQTDTAQMPRDRNERAHVLGQMRDAAVGQAAADRRAVGLARRIHQQRALGVLCEAEIAAARSIAGDRTNVCVAPAVAGEKRVDRHQPFEAGLTASVPGERDLPPCAAFDLDDCDVEAVVRQQ